MYRIILFVFVLLPVLTFAQSKSVNRFRSDFKENSNLFFYSSTIKMLNSDNNPEFAGILNGIEEIRVDKGPGGADGKQVLPDGPQLYVG